MNPQKRERYRKEQEAEEKRQADDKARADRDDRARDEKAKQRQAAEQDVSRERRMIAVLDRNDVLIGRIESPDDETWAKTPERLRFENGFDNPLKLYKLVEFRAGRWRFEAIVHAKDAASENHAADKHFPRGAIARAVFSLSMGEPVSDRDRGLISDYLGTFDGAV